MLVGMSYDKLNFVFKKNIITFAQMKNLSLNSLSYLYLEKGSGDTLL